MLQRRRRSERLDIRRPYRPCYVNLWGLGIEEASHGPPWEWRTCIRHGHLGCMGFWRYWGRSCIKTRVIQEGRIEHKHEPAGFSFLLENIHYLLYRVFVLSRITGRNRIEGRVVGHTMSALVTATAETMTTTMSRAECGLGGGPGDCTTYWHLSKSCSFREDNLIGISNCAFHLWPEAAPCHRTCGGA